MYFLIWIFMIYKKQLPLTSQPCGCLLHLSPHTPLKKRQNSVLQNPKSPISFFIVSKLQDLHLISIDLVQLYLYLYQLSVLSNVHVSLCTMVHLEYEADMLAV